jgi:hypothetical protein
MGWIAASGMLVGACIGLIRGANLGPEYLAVAVLKGTVLGASLAVTLGWLEQIAPVGSGGASPSAGQSSSAPPSTHRLRPACTL